MRRSSTIFALAFTLTFTLASVLATSASATRALVSGPAVADPGGSVLAATSHPGADVEAAAPDFNGDGFADLAAGAPHDGDVDGGVADAGSVNVLYGSVDGLQTGTPINQRWTQDIPNVRGTAESGDLFGSALAGADFNGDGFTDLAIGVPGDSAGGVADAGLVNVLYGGSDGLQAVSPDDQLWSQAGEAIEDVPEEGDAFGAALAAGDFNGDTFADLAIGIPGEDVHLTDPVADAGSVAVLYGSATGLQADAPADQLWDQDADGVRDKAEKGDAFGSALASGDFDGDGFDDLGIGVPGEKVGGFASAGATSVLYGEIGGLQAAGPDDQIWNQDSADVRDKAETGDAFGAALAAGDFDDDGFADLANGVPGETVGGFAAAGATSVLYGNNGGLQATGPDDQIWNQDSVDVKDKAALDESFGASLAAADFDGDGFAELAIGVPGEDVDGNDKAGAVSVLYGTGGGLQATIPDDQIWSQATDQVRGQPAPDEGFGAAVTGADFDGDLHDDLVVGVPGETIAGLVGAGAMNALYGTDAGVQAVSPDDQFWSQGTPGVAGVPGADENLGASVLGVV